MRAKLITTDTQIATSKIAIFGFIIHPDGSNALTIDIYNEADASKTASARIASARTPATESKEVIFPEPLVCSVGCYADLTGSNGIAYILIK